MNKKTLIPLGFALLLGAGCAKPPAETPATIPEAWQKPAPTSTQQGALTQEASVTSEEVQKLPATDEATGTTSTPVAPTGKLAGTVVSLKEVTITAGNFKYDLDSFSVKKGQKVKLTFKNGEGFHDFRIDELNVATNKIKAGEEQTIEFTPDKVGSFEYYCSVGSHRAMGMKGTITVTE
jgi:plastocyanin